MRNSGVVRNFVILFCSLWRAWICLRLWAMHVKICSQYWQGYDGIRKWTPSIWSIAIVFRLTDSLQIRQIQRFVEGSWVTILSNLLLRSLWSMFSNRFWKSAKICDFQFTIQFQRHQQCVMCLKCQLELNSTLLDFNNSIILRSNLVFTSQV